MELLCGTLISELSLISELDKKKDSTQLTELDKKKD
jgi:hypothetical protein